MSYNPPSDFQSPSNAGTPSFGPPGVAPPPTYPITVAPGIAPPRPEIIPNESPPEPVVLGPYPVSAVCPSCNVRVTTRTENQSSSSCCGCCGSDDKVRHFCTNCNFFFGTYEG